jgi:hypothetical protein
MPAAKQEVSIADLIGAVFKPAPKKAEEPSEAISAAPKAARQITAASPEKLAQIKELAEQTCELYDKIQELVGSLTVELGVKKKELLEDMLNHGLKQVEVSGRPPVELTIKNDKKPNKKNIIAVLGVDEGNKLWQALPTGSSEYLSIPPKTPPES